ncbi:MAG: hypothetical protein ACI91Z_002023 [Yoonia sp.]|jgi:hypothetical protein
MFTVARVSDVRIDLTIQGKITGPEMASGLTELLALSEGFEKGVMLYRIEGFKWPTFNAVMAEAIRIPKLFGLLKRFGKIAVISDKAWVRWAAAIEGAVIPKMKIKTFKPEQADAAEAWLAGNKA